MQRRTLTLMLAALVARMALWVLCPGLTYDGTYYLRQAERIFHFDFQVIGFPPGYPLVVAVVRLLSGDFELAGRFVSLVSGMATVGLFCVWARRRLPPWLVVAATLVLALHPEVARNSVEVTSEPLYILCVLAGIIAFEARRDLATGALFGFAFLVRPEALVFLVGGAAWRLWAWRRPETAIRDAGPDPGDLAARRGGFPWRFLVIGFLPVVAYSAIATHAIGHWVLTPKQGQIDIDADIWPRIWRTFVAMHAIFPLLLLPGALWQGWRAHRLLLVGVAPILALPFFTIHIQPRLLLPLLPFLLVLGLAWVAVLRRDWQRFALLGAAILLGWGAAPAIVSLHGRGIVTPYDKALGAQLRPHLRFEDRVAARFPFVPYYAGSGFVRVPVAPYVSTMDSIITAGATHLLVIEHEVLLMVPQLRPLFEDPVMATAEGRIDQVKVFAPAGGVRAILYRFRQPVLSSSQSVDSTAIAATWLGSGLVYVARDGKVHHDQSIAEVGARSLRLVSAARDLCASADSSRVAFLQQRDGSTQLAEIDLANAALRVHAATAVDMPLSPCYVDDALLYVRGAGSGGLRVLEPSGRVRAVYLAGLAAGEARPLSVTARGRDVAITFAPAKRQLDTHRVLATAVWPATVPADTAVVITGRWATQLSLADDAVSWVPDADRLVASVAVRELDEDGNIVGSFATLGVFGADGRLRTLGYGFDRPRRPALRAGRIAFLTGDAGLRTSPLDANDLRIPDVRVFDAPSLSQPRGSD